jgi:hypothetical protein
LAAPAVALGVRGVKVAVVILEMGMTVRVTLTVVRLELDSIEGIPSTNGETSTDVAPMLSTEEVAVTMMYEVVRQEVLNAFFWLTIIVLVLVLIIVSVEVVATGSVRINSPSELGVLEAGRGSRG